MAIRVAIVDDHLMFREGLRTMLARQGGYRVVCEAGDARSFLRELDRGAAFDVALVDIALPGSDGIALVRELRRRGLKQPAITLTMHVDVDVVARALRAGASGHVLKSQSTRQLCTAIETVLAKRRYVAPSIDGARLEAALAAPGGAVLTVLSPREREVFGMLSRGCSNADVAAELCVSIKTVRTHRAHIFEKLQIHSVAELVGLAARHNLLSPVAASARTAS